MQDAELISHYFPQLTERQKNQFAQLGNLYREWNDKINVISRKDVDNLYVNHVLHSLGIAKVMEFKSASIPAPFCCQRFYNEERQKLYLNLPDSHPG